MKKDELVKLYAAYKSGCLGNNILDTYFTFFANIILEENLETISEEEMQKCFEKKYQVELPLGFVRQVLGIGISNGAIIDERGAYLPKRDVLLKHKFEKSDFEKLWKELINEFKEFCNKKEIEVNEQHIEENIVSAIDNTDEIILSNDKLDEKESVDGFEYAWYSFVREEANANEKMFNFITALCASNITGQAIFYSGKEGEDYSGLNVYLDSPMIFALLGMDSNERESSYKLLVENMKKLNCNVMVLDHNYREVEGIITRAVGWALSTGYDIRKANNAARFFHDSQMTQEEITEFCGQIETKLNLLGIVKKDTDYDMLLDKFQEDEFDSLFAKFYYSFNGKEPRDDFKFQAQLDRLLKMTMIHEHSLLRFSYPLSDDSPVWSYLKQDYRSYRDNGNTKKMFENVCQSVADYKNCVKENNRNNLVKACRNLSAGLFYMDVHYRREIYKTMENKQAYGLLEEERPKAKIIGEDGNIFNLMGIASRTLKSAGYEEKANEMFERITFNAKSYDEALNIISEYVEPVENYEESFQMKGFE